MPPLENLNREQLNKLDKEMLIDALEKQVDEQAALIQKLQDELAKNSRNSSKPPSSDGLEKPESASKRETTTWRSASSLERMIGIRRRKWGYDSV